MWSFVGFFAVRESGFLLKKDSSLGRITRNQCSFPHLCPLSVSTHLHLSTTLHELRTERLIGVSWRRSGKEAPFWIHLRLLGSERASFPPEFVPKVGFVAGGPFRSFSISDMAEGRVFFNFVDWFRRGFFVLEICTYRFLLNFVERSDPFHRFCKENVFVEQSLQLFSFLTARSDALYEECRRFSWMNPMEIVGSRWISESSLCNFISLIDFPGKKIFPFFLVILLDV